MVSCISNSGAIVSACFESSGRKRISCRIQAIKDTFLVARNLVLGFPPGIPGIRDPSGALLVPFVGFMKSSTQLHSFLCCSSQTYGWPCPGQRVEVLRAQGCSLGPAPGKASARGSQCRTKSFLCPSVAASENGSPGEG